ncbi:ABC transporter substrate-binding protein [Streptomyces sp. H10-C2]|uniref:ABC transporter substrate-binding protein n=1 Tax=unclassified Streptomyces TaxID=2593676 RepID=UPI0024B99D28|nr:MULTISPECIES: ABC transporter substrate-binding protein [unclassified Streptomyces]MDJ0340896.1 ABC transporter substrate-binding protein [Streptomyces sp. PH10-H1]MDJ0369873.1 ABC transporter substrate-binding protein [Streptomyces sp. H10-C2]
MTWKRPTAAFAVGALCLATAACGASSRTAASAGKAEPPGPGYPVIVTDCGQTTTYTRPPSRVVVMNGASVAEVSSMLALGLGDRIIANAQSYGMSEVPGRVQAIAKLPTGGVHLNDIQDIPREAMLNLRPDFVLSTTGFGFDPKNGYATRKDLASVGANTYMPVKGCDDVTSVKGPPSIDDSYSMLRDLGRIFGVSARAEKLIADSRTRIAAVSAKVKAKLSGTAAGATPPKVMVIFSNMTMGANEFSSIAGVGIWNDILAKAVGANAFASVTGNSFADLSKEKVAAAQVEALVVVSYHDPDPDAYARKLFAQFPQWSAARNKKYVVLSDSIYLGPSNDVAVERVARMLHPEAL